MSRIAPQHVVRPRCWSAAQLYTRSNWRFALDAGILPDVNALLEWAATVVDPVAALRVDSVVTPYISQLAESMRREIRDGFGVAWVRGLRLMTEEVVRLVYLKLGLELGAPIETYARLYEVRDTGASYREAAVPVSQTRESTGMHTDSSGKDVLPRIVGLACVRQAARGGNTRLVSAAQAHEVLRRTRARMLERLYGDFVRDVVTPGGDRDPARVAENRFPVFSCSAALCFRYMRYWIERGHERVGELLDEEAGQALDALDAALSDPAHVVTFCMEPGDFLFIDNTLVAHDRDAYDEDLASPRLMLRLWLSDNNGGTS